MFATGTSPSEATTVAVPLAMLALWIEGEFETSDELLARRIEKRLTDDDKPYRVRRRGGRILIEIVESWEVAK